MAIFTLGIWSWWKSNTTSPQSVPEISVRDFMRRPNSSGYNISPDGDWIAYMAPWHSRQNIYVRNMKKDSTPIRVTRSKDRDISGYFWKKSDILYAKDKGGNENFHIYSASFNGKKEKDLTPYPNVRAHIIDPLQKDRDHILISMNKKDAKVFDVYKLNVTTGQVKLVIENPGNIDGYMSDPEGKILLAVTFDGTILRRNTENEPFQTFLTVQSPGDIQLLEFSQDKQEIYALSSKGRDKAALVTFDRQGKEKIIYAHPDVDVAGASFRHRDRKLCAVSYETDKVYHKFFDTSWQTFHQKLQRKLNVSESEFAIASADEAETKFIIIASNDKFSGKYYYYDTKNDQLTLIIDTSSWLNPAHMADMRPVSYKSRDGLTIHGYLTLPKNKPPKSKKFPLIVNPHGGPNARDGWGFNGEVQLLANRGYAVLQMNFRASTGYGKKLKDAGNKEWGRNIQHDITDGVQWAIEQGIADPRRIAIYGASFGGYAALAGITFTPHLYAAAASYVGPSNLFTMLATLPPYWEGYRNEQYKRIGHPVKDKALLTKASPLFHVHNIITPLFVAQGANDPRVKKMESDQIVNAIRKKGLEVEYMVKENEGHGFRNIENQIEFYERMLKFLAKHLHPKK